jgi:urease accessory protein
MTAVPEPAPITPRSGWAATLELEFVARPSSHEHEPVARQNAHVQPGMLCEVPQQLESQVSPARAQTILARRQHRGPLLVQRPFYPEGPVCHAYIVHPPGGIVGGDQLALHVTAGPGSHALLTTPAATKFYRNAGRTAVQRQHLHLDGATVEWLPQETILYPQASAEIITRVQLCERSRFIGWEIVCYGRPASQLPYAEGQASQDFELWLDDVPLVIDRLRLDGSTEPMQARYGLAGAPVLATLFAYPANEALLESLRLIESPHASFAATCVDGALVARAAGRQVDRVRAVMENAWKRLRPHVIGLDPVAPRIWAT